LSERAVTGLPATPRKDYLTRRVLEVDLGAEQVEAALEFATYTDPPDEPPSPMRQLLERLHDPTFASHSITQLMHAVGVRLPELLDAIRQRDIALAIANSGKRLGSVVDGLGEAAEPRWGICSECEGEGWVVDKRAEAELDTDADIGEERLTDLPTKKCLAVNGGCDGTGKVRLRGNLDAAKLFLEVHGMKRGGSGGGGNNTSVTVPVQVNVPLDDRRSVQKPIDVTTTVQKILENGG
jgi:hypothetical protein